MIAPSLLLAALLGCAKPPAEPHLDVTRCASRNEPYIAWDWTRFPEHEIYASIESGDLEPCVPQLLQHPEYRFRKYGYLWMSSHQGKHLGMSREELVAGAENPGPPETPDGRIHLAVRNALCLEEDRMLVLGTLLRINNRMNTDTRELCEELDRPAFCSKEPDE